VNFYEELHILYHIWTGISPRMTASVCVKNVLFLV